MKKNIFTIEETPLTKEIREKQEAVELEKDKQKRINYGITFSTREGFDVLQDIFKMCHFDRISYVQGDTHETAFMEGERNIALYIWSLLSDEMKQQILLGGK